MVSVHVHPQGVPSFRQGATFLTEVRDPADVASLNVVSQVLSLAQTFPRGGLPTCLLSERLVNIDILLKGSLALPMCEDECEDKDNMI